MTITATAPARRIGRVRLGDVEPDLAQPRTGDEGAAVATIAIVEIPAGAPLAADTLIGDRGALVLEGIMLRDVGVAGHSMTEIIAPGDVIATAHGDDGDGTGDTIRLRALERTLVADLSSIEGADRSAQTALLESTATRLQDQLARASMRCAITSLIRVDLRLLAYLWHVANAFGVVTPAGVKLDLPLTHALLANLIGARRPTVTTAFGVLGDQGYIKRDGRAIILVGDRLSALEGAASNS